MGDNCTPKCRRYNLTTDKRWCDSEPVTEENWRSTATYGNNSMYRELCDAQGALGNLRYRYKRLEARLEAKTEIIKGFGVEMCERCGENPAKPVHSCPYSDELDPGSESSCNCCDDCFGHCADDV